MINRFYRQQTWVRSTLYDKMGHDGHDVHNSS